LLWISHFHCCHEARNMDARYHSSNRPFSMCACMMRPTHHRSIVKHPWCT
jgi:hypothetical protein